MTRSPVTGSLAFASHDGIVYSSGLIGGRVSLTGPLSQTLVTVGVGLEIAPGTRHWLNEIATGALGVFLPGDEHDALYMPGSLYATATLTAEHLEDIAARAGLVLDTLTLGGTGIEERRFAGQDLTNLRKRFGQVHAGHAGGTPNPAALGPHMLDLMIQRLGRPPRIQPGEYDPRGYVRIVARARAHIHDNLDGPLSIEEIAAAAITSHRTLHRAFQAVLDETPYSYVQKLRLHRIRHELVSDDERAATITSVANQWGISELGRFAAWYRELFGELPSETLARQRRAAPRAAT